MSMHTQPFTFTALITFDAEMRERGGSVAVMR